MKRIIRITHTIEWVSMDAGWLYFAYSIDIVLKVSFTERGHQTFAPVGVAKVLKAEYVKHTDGMAVVLPRRLGEQRVVDVQHHPVKEKNKEQNERVRGKRKKKEGQTLTTTALNHPISSTNYGTRQGWLRNQLILSESNQTNWFSPRVTNSSKCYQRTLPLIHAFETQRVRLKSWGRKIVFLGWKYKWIVWLEETCYLWKFVSND